MIQYVLGFAFATEPFHANTYVALIEKTKPAWQAGKCNGIGGKIEPGESCRVAMSREFREETGVETDPDAWVQFAKMEFDDAEVFCYVGGMSWEKFNSLWSPTPEQVIKVRVGQLWNFKPLPSLSWLVPMAQAYLADQTMNRLVIRDGKRFACSDDE